MEASVKGSDGMVEGRWLCHRTGLWWGRGGSGEASFTEEVTQLSLESVCGGVGRSGQRREEENSWMG